MDLNNVGTKEKTAIETELDKQIVIKFMKEKKTSRTYIFGLHHFLDDAGIEKLCANMKKSLGTSHFVNVEGDIKSHGFQGEHAKRIYELLVGQKIAPVDKIKQMN